MHPQTVTKLDIFPGPLGGESLEDLEEKIDPTDNDNTSSPGMIVAEDSEMAPGFDSGPPPDGGLRAWTQVIVGALVNFNTFGYITSFGVFQDQYVNTLRRSPSDISWIGSFNICLVFFIGAFSGRAVDAGHSRILFLSGALLMLVGVFMTSLASTYWQLLLAQAICTGLGMGLIFCPTVAIIASYFTRKRSLALSSSAAGGAVGGMVFPAIAKELLPELGLPWTVRVMGFVMLFNFCFICFFIRSRLPPRKSGPLIEPSAFKELPYLLFTTGMFFIGWGIYFPYYYIVPFAKESFGHSRSSSVSLLLILNGLGIPGRLVPAQLADRYFGPLNLLIPTALLSGILVYCWIVVESYEGLIGFSIVYGYVGAGVQSLFPATLATLTDDLNKMGTRVGMVFTIYGMAVLTGSPICGALISSNGGSYLTAQIFGGTVILGGSLLLLGARSAKLGKTLIRRI